MIAAIVLLLNLALQPTTAPSPYAGEESRSIKALSKEQIDGYLSARGMGLARAAELNSYPGPMHVLELADQLGLTREQADQTRRAFDEMKQRATELGRAIVERERELDGHFAEKTINERVMHEKILEIGRLHAELRAAHLRAHLRMREVLTPAQVDKYDELRGYRTSGK
jgi:Spy/CpxP family protein refolding chaperone